MSPQSSATEPPEAAAADANNLWQFAWEAQSHTSILRLLLFNPSTKPSAQCRDLKVSLLPQNHLLTVSFLEGEGQSETEFKVPVPRVLIDSESRLHFRAFDDHIEVKFVLLLPVDHPLVSDFDSILNNGENGNVLRPLSVDSDLKKLSCKKEVQFYCRNCSSKLTKCIRCFKEMPSVNWRDAADNWFGNCCCSFGGVSEKLVDEFAKSYTCVPGLCLLSPTAVLLSKNDVLGFESADDNLSSSRVSINEGSEKCEDHSDGLSGIQRTQKDLSGEDKLLEKEGYESSKDFLDGDISASTFSALQIEENLTLKNGKTQNCDIGFCTPCRVDTPSKVKQNEGNVELLENQKMFLNGYLGNGFMVRSSELSKDIRWANFSCPQCSRLVGAYPCFDDYVPLDGGIRLFKSCISTGLPSTGSDDTFENYTLERMFASQLLESAEDELSFKTIVRDIQTKLPVLQIVLLNPNSWGCAGSLNHAETADKLALYPIIKVLFSASSHGMEFDSRTSDEWVRKNEADEIYMFSSQILELIRVLELANSLSPPSCRSLQGSLLSSMKR